MADRLLQDENCADDLEVSVMLTNDRRIAQLNKQYRNVDGPTDVLAFVQDAQDELPADSDERMLGDVVISVETAARQAEERRYTCGEEIDVLLVHGMLHLLGYDHAEPEETRRMFERQAEIVKHAEQDRRCGTDK